MESCRPIKRLKGKKKKRRRRLQIRVALGLRQFTVTTVVKPMVKNIKTAKMYKICNYQYWM
jgi:hypothetical protein